MTKVIVYKTVDNSISVLTAASKSDVQKSLNVHDINSWIRKHQDAGNYEVARGASRAHHDKRIAWANTVVSFHSLTDAEFDKFIECDIAEGAQYFHWLDHTQLPQLDPHRDAWCDIDANGKVSYDFAKARANALVTLGHRIAEAKATIETLDNQGTLPTEQPMLDAINRLADLQARVQKVKTVVINSIEDLTAVMGN